jgi:uncharacterized protein YxjI
MEIDINQKKITFGDKYRVFIDGQLTHTASTELFRLFPEINLFHNTGGEPKLTINKRHTWFKAKYDITFWDNNVLEFRTKSIWRNHFQCQVGPDRFDIYGHKGRKYSVYKNDKQVAWWDKEMVSWFQRDNYKILADADVDYELIIAFCLITDNHSSSSNEGNTVTFDLGKIGPQTKVFNPNWQPKQ